MSSPLKLWAHLCPLTGWDLSECPARSWDPELEWTTPCIHSKQMKCRSAEMQSDKDTIKFNVRQQHWVFIILVIFIVYTNTLKLKGKQFTTLQWNVLYMLLTIEYKKAPNIIKQSEIPNTTCVNYSSENQNVGVYAYLLESLGGKKLFKPRQK